MQSSSPIATIEAAQTPLPTGTVEIDSTNTYTAPPPLIESTKDHALEPAVQPTLSARASATTTAAEVSTVRTVSVLGLWRPTRNNSTSQTSTTAPLVQVPLVPCSSLALQVRVKLVTVVKMMLCFSLRRTGKKQRSFFLNPPSSRFVCGCARIPPSSRGVCACD